MKIRQLSRIYFREDDTFVVVFAVVHLAKREGQASADCKNWGQTPISHCHRIETVSDPNSTLHAQKDMIEKELGYALVWDELPSGRDSRIHRVLDNVDPDNETQWPRQHDWLADTLNAMHRVFSRRVRELDAGQ